MMKICMYIKVKESFVHHSMVLFWPFQCTADIEVTWCRLLLLFCCCKYLEITNENGCQDVTEHEGLIVFFFFFFLFVKYMKCIVWIGN